MSRFRLAAALLAAGSGLAAADEPPPPAADWSATTGEVRVEADLSGDVTRVRGPGGDWVVPRWVRNLRVAPDGGAALVLPAGHPLIEDRDPDRVVLEVFGPEGLRRAIRLEEIAHPAALPATASHVLLIEDVRWHEDAALWALHLAGGGIMLVFPDTGAVSPPG